MTREEAIRIFRKEIECLSHAKCEDCILEKVCDPAKTTPLDSEYIEAYGMAIQALSQEPTEKPMTVDEMEREYEKSKALFHKIVERDDAVSRDAVIMECIKYADHEHNVQFKKEVSETRKHDGQVIIYACDYFKTFVEKLPSVTHKSGKWIEHPEIETSTPEYLMFYECSECGNKQCFCKSDIHKKRFCSNCGAKMESEE